MTVPRVTKQSLTRQQVLELIERLGVGTAIPSERQLSADLGVSRLTLRAALDDLAREGYRVLPVNPTLAGTQILGEPVVPTLADLAGPVDVIDLASAAVRDAQTSGV